MNLSEPFIRRPIATTLLAAALALAGMLAYALLPVASLPRVDFPTIQVNAALPGASPETMASSVATPLERRFGRIAGVTEMTSQSALGTTSITLQFDLDRNVDAAARDVQAAIAAAGGELPPDLPLKPTYRKVNPSDAPILILAMTSETLPLSVVYDQGNTILAQKISQVPGVGQVYVGGGQQPAVRVQVDPLQLASMGMTPADVRATLGGSTTDSAKGVLVGPSQAHSIGANDQLFDAQGYGGVLVAADPHGQTHLHELARVEDDVENSRTAAWADGHPAVLVIIRKQPGANVIATNDRVRAILPLLTASIHPAIKTEVLFDRTLTIQASVREVERTLVLAVVLVVLVVFVFLRSGRATIIPSVAVPLSLIGTCGVMYLLDYSVDNLSLMALTIATGFVVDDAIVVTENVAKHIEQGVPRFQAALLGAREIGFTIVSITASLLAVFIPLLLMGGIVGRLFREFAVTLGVAVLVSAVVSLTLTPMMCAYLLPSERESHGRLYTWSENAFQRPIAAYERALKWVLGHQRLMLGVTIATVVVNGVLFWLAPKGLFPQQDGGLLIGLTEAAQDVSFASMSEHQKEVNAVIGADPDVGHFVAFVGNGTGNTASAFVLLGPKPPRKTSADDVVVRLRGKLSHLAGVRLYLQSMQDVRVGGLLARTQYQYTLEDANLEELRQWSPRMLDALTKLPQLRDVATDQQSAGLELDLAIDRDTAARVGVSAQAIDDALYDAFGQRQVATNYTELNEYRVVLETTDPYRRTPDALDAIYVSSQTGPPVPLRALTTATPSTAPLAVNHVGQFPAVTLSFNLGPGVSLGQAVDAIGEARRGLGAPPALQAKFQGTAEAFTSSLATEPWLVLAALVAVYIVLGVLYESLVHPITILSTLPSAGIGALLALIVLGIDLSVIALIGVLLLVGIVKKNAILMIDVAIERQRKEGIGPEEAIFNAASLRFRPILMTTCAAMLGAMPLVFGTGLGSELRRPLGITIVGGLLASQALTLFTTPVVYVALDRLRRARHASPHPTSPMVMGEGKRTTTT